MRWQSYHRNLLALAEHGDSLTESQKKACQSIQQAVSDYEQRINLWGSPGTGKTFLAHYLHHSAEGLYFRSAEYYQSSEVSPNSVIIIDNAPPDRKSARDVFGDILWQGAFSVILITRKPIHDAVKKVHLSLGEDDIEQIQTVIRHKFGPSRIQVPDGYDFQQSGIWTLVKALSIGT